jgi:outer membrane protein
VRPACPISLRRPPPSIISYKLARENQPDLLSSQASIKQLEIDAKTAKNARLPSLDLGGALGYNTKESTSRRAFSELPGSDGYSWEVDLSLRLPWGLKAERARYRSSLSLLNQAPRTPAAA